MYVNVPQLLKINDNYHLYIYIYYIYIYYVHWETSLFLWPLSIAISTSPEANNPTSCPQTLALSSPTAPLMPSDTCTQAKVPPWMRGTSQTRLQGSAADWCPIEKWLPKKCCETTGKPQLFGKLQTAVKVRTASLSSLDLSYPYSTVVSWIADIIVCWPSCRSTTPVGQMYDMYMDMQYTAIIQ